MIAASLSGGGHPNSNVPARHREDDSNLIMGSSIDEGMARPLVSRATGYRMDMESENFVVADGGRGDHNDTPVAYPLRASDGHHGWSAGRGDGNDNFVVADPISSREQKTWTHEGSHNFRTHNLQEATWQNGVRRLTPLECERLQGFPDGWTEGPADAHRYRMLGNAVNTVVAQWLGHRLVRVEQLWSC